MALSRLAREFAAEIRNHDWSDAPYRIDRAGHRREIDTNKGATVLTSQETERVHMNVMWVTAQVLGHADENFDVYEFAEACGIRTRNVRGGKDGTIEAGVRLKDGKTYCAPGKWFDDE